MLKALGFSHISARPQHPKQDERTIAAFKKNFAATLSAHTTHLPKGTPIEIWFQDEARIGQKNGLVRQWAKLARGHGERSSAGWPAEGRTGTRPRQPADQRYESASLFGAICPARGVDAALALPRAITESMQAHLKEISETVAKGAHVVLLLDQAGWHTTPDLDMPENLTLIFLPSRAPELTLRLQLHSASLSGAPCRLRPVENIWQYPRENWLSNLVFDTYEAVIDAACETWNKLIKQPNTIKSIGLRDWAHTGQR